MSCNQKYNNIFEYILNIKYVEYSWHSTLHYYLKSISLITLHYALSSYAHWFCILDICLNIAIIIAVFYVTSYSHTFQFLDFYY